MGLGTEEIKRLGDAGLLEAARCEVSVTANLACGEPADRRIGARRYCIEHASRLRSIDRALSPVDA